jgi:transposase InsO family protein
MSLARVVVTSVLVEGRSKAAVARDYGLSRRWVHELVRRFEAAGEAGLEPRSRRPRASPHQIPEALEQEIVELRKQLADEGLDAGAHTIAVHLQRRHGASPAVSSIWRVLSRRGFVTPQPQKRPRSSFVRFAADQPNERWQADITHWSLSDGRDVELLNMIDDHARLLVGSEARAVFKAADVVACFHHAAATWDFPASLLTDNGAVFTAGPRGGGRCAIELECDRLGIKMAHSTPYHPQTCGTVERFHQSLKRYLAKQPRVSTIAELQGQLDRFRAYYNEVRPHRALDRRTPAEAYAGRPKATPRGPQIPVHCRVRRDRIDRGGGVTLRHDSVLRHIKVGARHAGTRVVMLVAGLHVRIVSEDGELLRELTIDPSRVYQPMGGRWNDVPGHV